MTNATRRRRIGVFIEWLSDGYSDPVLKEIVAAAEERGVDVRCFVGGCYDFDFPIARRHLPLVYASREVIDGAVVVSLGNHITTSAIETVFGRFDGMPLCGMAIQWTLFPSVEVDNERGLQNGVRHLIQKHRRRKLACIRGPEKSTEADTRFRAYREVLSEFGLPYDERYVASGYYTRQDGVDAVRTLLDERELEIDAIVAANDAMALGAMEELGRRGISVPDSVALLGFDDIEEARHARPPLSTVRQPFRDHARRAFEVVMDQLEGRAVAPRTRIDSQLILRRSCGCARSRGWMPSSAPPPPEATRRVEALDAWARECSRTLLDFFGRFTGVEGLSDRFLAALLDAAGSGDAHEFLDMLDSRLDRIGRSSGDLLLLLPLLHSRQKALRGVALTDAEFDCLDNALCAAIGLVSEAAERLEAQQRHAATTQINRVLRMNEALMHAQGIEALATVLAEHLPALGVRSCYACLWEGEAVPAQWARLVLACEEGKARVLPAEGVRFPATEVLPKELGLDAAPSSWLICPALRLDPTSMAYLVLLLGTAEAFVYDALVDQIGSHFKRLDLVQRLETANRQLEAAAHTDALTQLHNRRSLMDLFEREFKISKRHGTELSLALIDLDHFKKVNDTYGHLAGDMVLKRVAGLLTANRRATDLVGRYGGEELCVVFVHTALEPAAGVADRLRTAIAELEFAADGRKFTVTASIGIAEVAVSDHTVEEVVRRADRALYRAKSLGRNRVECEANGGS
jgi:diguanylate cyclase (GGDEF)-like protein